MSVVVHLHTFQPSQALLLGSRIQSHDAVTRRVHTTSIHLKNLSYHHPRSAPTTNDAIVDRLKLRKSNIPHGFEHPIRIQPYRSSEHRCMRSSNVSLLTAARLIALLFTFRFIDAFTILLYLAFTLFAAMRTYAIWDKNKLVLASVLGLGLLYPVEYMYYCSQRAAKASLSPAIGCQFVSSLPTGTSLDAAREHVFGMFNCTTMLQIQGK
ncbi:hypothetical protein BDY19DRAFT_998578 [Irpex rosettiformis]|uniref:Uncharacterized protein n=1 Tax=Irpex rosettiformis TaxID=378272 RepID=A0ACB8TN66_9APHY|nr:hypothetical protein BDY19DRAFT_998578 [Irpex rosettiformis]